MNNVAVLQNVTKTYIMGETRLDALKNITLEFAAGEYCAIMGPSGSGKSTFLNITGCLDRPTSGKYILGGEDVSELDDNELSELRCKYLGFIFQSYNLIAQLSVLENIEVPMFYRGVPHHEARERSTELAEKVGLADRLHHRPHELSGGQQQRVAIARALANDPLVLLADEPTGNLDSATEKEILEMLGELNELGKTIIVVTHDESVAECARRVVTLHDGEVVSDVRNGPPPRAQEQPVFA